MLKKYLLKEKIIEGLLYILIIIMACGLICSIIDMNICIIIYLLILGTLIYKSWRLRNF